MRIRFVKDSDVPHLVNITNDAIAHTTAHWDHCTVDDDDRRAWLREHQAVNIPVLIAVDDDERFLGFATWGPFRSKDGYSRTAEHSVYVVDDAQGKGVGSQLLGELLTHAHQYGIHIMVAAIEASNVPSIRLHKKFGFIETGRMPEVGTKFGRWLDLVLMQITLAP